MSPTSRRKVPTLLGLNGWYRQHTVGRSTRRIGPDLPPFSGARAATAAAADRCTGRAAGSGRSEGARREVWGKDHGAKDG